MHGHYYLYQRGHPEISTFPTYHMISHKGWHQNMTQILVYADFIDTDNRNREQTMQALTLIQYDKGNKVLFFFSHITIQMKHEKDMITYFSCSMTFPQ